MDILGVDVSKSKFDVALLREDEYLLATFDNDSVGFVKLRKWLKKRKVDILHACLEATGRYGDELALFLHEAGYQVSMVNPVRIQSYAASQLKRNKTDKEDAKLIAHFCATQAPEPWTPPLQVQQELQAMVRHLDALQLMRQQESNRLQAGVPSTAVREVLEAHIAFLDEQIGQLAQRIRDHIEQHPDLKQRETPVDFHSRHRRSDGCQTTGGNPTSGAIRRSAAAGCLCWSYAVPASIWFECVSPWTFVEDWQRPLAESTLYAGAGRSPLESDYSGFC